MRYRIEANGIAIGIERDRLVPPDGRFDETLVVAGAELRPGLINAHDHLHRNHYPRLGAPPYQDAYAWGRDLHARWAPEIERARALPRRDALLFGAFKNLLGGATTVVHHDAWEPDFERDFPVRVARVRTLHSPGFDGAAVATAAENPPAAPWMIHLAEGTNDAAADEIRELDRLGLLDRHLLAVHVVGADDDGVRRLRAARAALVWCPTSNHFLFGGTCTPALLDAVDVLLGTDALLTGDGTLLDELRAARALGVVSDARLEAAVGATAARRLGLGERSLAPGAPADLVLLRRPLLDAGAADVALVIVDGRPRFGDVEFAPLFRACGVAVDAVDAGEVHRIVTQPLAMVAARVVEDWPDCGRLLALAAGHASAVVPDV
jgi:hypothetical protein